MKSFLEQVNKEYQELSEKLLNSYRVANQNYKQQRTERVYTEEELQKMLRRTTEQASTEFTDATAALNRKVKQRLHDLKNKTFPALAVHDVPADYAVRINNALQFLMVEGADITDSTASEILADFLSDPATMKRFRSVIEKQKAESLSDAYGNTTFPLTFGPLERVEKFTAAFSELEGMVNGLYIRNMAESETEYIPGGAKLYVPTNGYTQLVLEQAAVEQAGTVAAMIAELLPVQE